MGSENQSALDEALREHEKYAMEYHSTTHLGGYDACARCGPDRQLRDDAAAELARMRLLVRDVCEDLHGDVCEATCDSYGHAEKCRVVSALEEVRALIAENARMREALEKIASETAATWVCDTARATPPRAEVDVLDMIDVERLVRAYHGSAFLSADADAKTAMVMDMEAALRRAFEKR